MGKLYDSGRECKGTAQLPAEPYTWRNGYITRGRCPHCGKDVATSTGGFLRSHTPANA